MENDTFVDDIVYAIKHALKDEKYALEKELEARCDDFNELNEDVEKFAEAFAVQHAELLKLQAENKKLKELSQNY